MPPLFSPALASFNRVLLLAACAAFETGAAFAQTPPGPGQEQFQKHCAGCHGADAQGGDHGPDLVNMRHPRSRTPEGLREIIQNGIVSGGMPAFHLPEDELQQVTAYLVLLTSPAMNVRMSGDAAAGERFFFGQGNCAQCHMVKGRGGIPGPDLTFIGRERRLGQIEAALRADSAISARPSDGYQMTSLRLKDGRMLRGLVKNESSFDIQLESLDGVLHSVERSDVVSDNRDSKRLMPPFQASEQEFQNLLAYLAHLSEPPGPGSVVGAGAKAAGGGTAFEKLIHPEAGEWPTYHGQYSGNRHSPLTLLNPENIARLAPQWLFPIANSERLEVTPVVADGVMYVTTANQVFALDPQTGRQIWHYSRALTKGVIGDAGGAINRGVAVLDNRVFFVTDNAHLVALDRSNGQILWDAEMADYRKHYGATSAPLAVKDLVLSGTSGGDEGARGFIDAYKATTGERVWRFWTMPAPGEPLSETWIGKAIEHGCSASWFTGTYDPESDIVYWTTGNPCPDYNGDERQGDNLYSSSVLALERATGKLKWYYQYTPHDLHDWDAVQVPMLIDTVIGGGEKRKLLAQANRNGFFYLLDRTTGKLLLAKPFVRKLTWASGIGPDGRPVLLPDSDPTPQGTRVCPSVGGATNWMSTAFNPQTGLFYLVADESCEIYSKSPEWWKPGESFYGGAARGVPGEQGQKFVRALDLKTGNIVWEFPEAGRSRTWGGVLSTASNLLFICENSGAFAALDARSGKPLWHFQTNQSWRASPMTYLAGGRQYVAVAAGSNIISFSLPPLAAGER